VKKTIPILRIILTILLLSGVFYGIYYANVTDSLKNMGNCDITASTCVTTVFEQPFSVTFNQAPITEEELFLTFEISTRLSIEKAWIEGVNMYMGKTPVLFENAKKLEQAVTFLGSCNLAEMQWLLHVEIKNNATNKVALRVFTFSTYTD
jgi:hypothetical protein